MLHIDVMASQSLSAVRMGNWHVLIRETLTMRCLIKPDAYLPPNHLRHNLVTYFPLHANRMGKSLPRKRNLNNRNATKGSDTFPLRKKYKYSASFPLRCSARSSAIKSRANPQDRSTDLGRHLESRSERSWLEDDSPYRYLVVDSAVLEGDKSVGRNGSHVTIAILLEKESRVFFDMGYFLGFVVKGEWKEAEKYLSGYTGVDDNRYSKRMYFNIRKNKYYEALARKDYARAREILVKELQVFSTVNEVVVLKLTMLLVNTDFRMEDVQSPREEVLTELRKLIVKNPLLENKLQSPSITEARLEELLNQRIDWQYNKCKDPRHLDDHSFYVDHICGDSNVPRNTASGMKRPRHPHISEVEIIDRAASAAFKRLKSMLHQFKNADNQSLVKGEKQSDDMEGREVGKPLMISVSSQIHCLRFQGPESTAKFGISVSLK